MKLISLFLMPFCLGGASFPLLVWLLGYRERMRRQRVEALINRVIGATPRKTMRLARGRR